MSKPTSLRIITEPAGPGKGYWFWIRIYDSVDELREAAHRHHPWRGREHWANVYGVCQTVPFRETYISKGKWELKLPPNKGLGVIRLARPYTYEHVAHEIGHAAINTYRMVVKRTANFGTDTAKAEEDFCYILGELLDQFMYWLHGTDKGSDDLAKNT